MRMMGTSNYFMEPWPQQLKGKSNYTVATSTTPKVHSLYCMQVVHCWKLGSTVVGHLLVVVLMKSLG